MDFEPIVYKVYALLDAENRILNIDGGVTIANVDIATWTLIDEGTDPRKYGGCQQHYVQMPLRTMQGAYRYKLVDGNPVECTAEEIAQQEEANRPEPAPEEVSVWDELDAAYQEGVDSV